ncbi:LbetaH domain-containing protein [Pontibacter burrus]|uniref:Acetyltransferase n=1 Tax=Pontibacter burrus TaxID=2704466 RepID=A0A6B3LLS0_9BACT|nr:acetyltransferase [Pontibacter burrus]NEM97739.1 acetyltransferase [Pontibacter burrus]
MLKKKLVIFPFNGNGVEALDCINYDEYEVVGFIDDDSSKKSEAYDLYNRSILEKYKDLKVLAVPGSPTTYLQRINIIDSLAVDYNRFVTIVHPEAKIGRNVKIGNNCLVMAGVVLTSNACIGNHVIILPNTVVHHDSVLKDYTLVGSNVVVAGGTTIDTNCYIGSGANISNGLTIGRSVLVGLGSNILKNVPDNARMVGNPARNLNMLISEKVV